MHRHSAPRARFRLFVLGLTTTLGCACGAPAAEGASAAPPASQADEPPASPADYEVHEWGLLRAGAADVLDLGAAPPPMTFVPMVVEKPVLYFHASAPLSLREVVATIPGGTVAEAWPLVPLGASVTWRDVTIDPGAACAPSPLPSASDAPCAGLPAGESCESSTLAGVRTSEAACVRVGGASERFLFYRGRVTRFTPPLRFEHVGGSTSGEISVTNESDAEIPGVLVRIRRTGARTETLTASAPAAHATVIVGSDFDAQAAEEDRPVEETPMAVSEQSPLPSTTGAGRAGLRRSARALGLTEEEAGVFVATWSDALFGQDGAMAMEHLPAPTDAFVYFLPEALDENVATLAFDPPPRAVHRALAVWSVVPPTGVGH